MDQVELAAFFSLSAFHGERIFQGSLVLFEISIILIDFFRFTNNYIPDIIIIRKKK